MEDKKCESHSQPSEEVKRSGCRALKITQKHRLMRRIYETVVAKTIFLLRHGDSLVLPYITFFSIDWKAKTICVTTTFHTWCKQES